MSTIYLVRHGQGGTRESYDSLSDLGRRQARHLGEHWIAQGIQFAAAYTGRLRRQRQTGAGVEQAYRRAGISFPEIVTDSAWDEFDLETVYREIGPRLCGEDPEFEKEYEAMREQMRIARNRLGAEVHRRWLRCDTKVVRAWMSGKYRCEGETWADFRRRVMSCRFVRDGQGEASILAFTSAMPIAIWAGLALELDDAKAMRLAGVLYNCSYTVLRLRGESLRLLTFNASPCLTAELRTFR